MKLGAESKVDKLRFMYYKLRAVANIADGA